jgi:hypothetical protein
MVGGIVLGLFALGLAVILIRLILKINRFDRLS